MFLFFGILVVTPAVNHSGIWSSHISLLKVVVVVVVIIIIIIIIIIDCSK